MKNMSLFLLFVSLVPVVFGYSAEELLEAVPAECSDEAYLRFNETGNRTEWGKPYGQRTTVLEQLIDAEEKEGKGRFLPKLAEFLEVLLSMRTWTLNAHDAALKSFNNEQPIVELGSARLGLSVARAVTLFGDKLPADLVRRARAELERRIFEPYLKTAAEAKADSKRTKFSIREHWWFRTCNNWNAVCHSLVVRSALVYYPEGSAERATIVASAVDALPYFLSGFTDDGYCSEGAGYWNYGYGHFLMLGRALRAAPEKIDLFANPKTRTIAEYGFKYKMTPTVSPQFADGGGSPDEKFLAMCREIWPDIDKGSLPCSSRFDQAQVFLSRKIPGGLTLGLKGGHNDEFHNHNDIGSYDIAVGDVILTGDVGGEVYTKRTFSKDRYVSKVLNSYGHPVPRINGQLQGTGRRYCATMKESVFADDRDTVVMDLAKAYPQSDKKENSAEVVSLARTFVVDRAAKAPITITDKFVLREPGTIEDPLLTLGTFENIKASSDGKSWTGIIVRDGVRLNFTLTGSVPGESFSETIVNSGKLPPKVFGLRFRDVSEVTVTCTFSTGPVCD